MLIFGPYTAMPNDESFVIYNLSSLTQVVPRLPGLFVVPNQPMCVNADDYERSEEKSFDMWYYDYVLNDTTACSSLMMILQSLYDGKDVYVCIADYVTDSFISVLNESFMKLIQARYDIKYSIINTAEDFYYINKDGCVFNSVNGIYNFDADRNRFMQLSEEQRIMSGGVINDY